MNNSCVRYFSITDHMETLFAYKPGGVREAINVRKPYACFISL